MLHVHLVHISDRVLYEGDAESVLLPGVCGEFEVGERHVPIAALLASGKIRVRLPRDGSGPRELGAAAVRQGLMRFDGRTLFAVVE